MRECVVWAFPDYGPLSEDLAAKLKKGPAKCVYCVRCTHQYS